MTNPGFYVPPPADRELTPDTVRVVVREQFPDLDVASLDRLGDGWEHEAYLVDGHVVFRFPRYADVGRGFELEQRRLALVSSAIGDITGIPTITRWGRPSALFPHPFAGHELIPGLEASDPRVPRHPALADDLGYVLGRLHAIPADAAAESAGIDTSTVQRTDLPAAIERIRSWVREVPEIRDHAPQACAWLEESHDAPSSYGGAPRFLHDDLQMEHVIVRPASGRLSGIIDWGGAFGDPARDFSYVLLHGGHTFFQRAIQAYDLPLDTEFAERTLFSARLGALAWLADAIKRGSNVSREVEIVQRVFELA